MTDIMNRFTSILLAGLIASASALGISPKADANTRVDYLAGSDSYGYQHNDDGYYERQSRHHRNDDYERENDLLNIRDNNYRYERENYRRHDRDYNRRYERENNRHYERYNNIRNNRDNNNRYEHERDWGRG
ncbi:hypothetical protein [Nostoc sp.]|uniref:hypothetical protein n=1 Tax=Nostoc sp. TaxID=1180 RepID=UPI002FF73683